MCDVNTILDHLRMTGMGSFEFSNGRWGAFTDFIYFESRRFKFEYPQSFGWRRADPGHRHCGYQF